MRAVRELIAKMFDHKDAEQARRRLEADQKKADSAADRIDRGADELEQRVFEVNHLTEAVANLWRQHR